MSTALVQLGYARHRQKFRMSAKEICITVAWASLALLIGLGIASSLQTANPVTADSPTSQGL